MQYYLDSMAWMVGAGSRVSEVASHVNDSLQQDTDWFGIGSLVTIQLITIVGIVALYRWRLRPRRKFCKPVQLFTELCKVHKIRRREQRQLLQFAETLDIAQPAMLFTVPELFDSVLQCADKNSREELLSIKDRLFG